VIEHANLCARSGVADCVLCRVFAGRVQGDAAAMSMRMDSTALTTSLHGLRGMGLILNLGYPRNLRLHVA
jgi:hypothetical protein